MNTEHHFTNDLQQLLKRGYSADDLRTVLSAPADLVDRAVLQYREEIQQRQHDRKLHSQATYAMRLQRR
ncbi:MAG: hypothetical protein CMI01_08755 [Oceanospirillaceae bacterium]|jgi:hypothetical protein|uniref:hypothetical protein n=1 Tax=Marinobacterium litorale TaxID=404770 RepID=UPI000428A9F8|nr:hypothetical protein [Marinobacterium litorale]MBS98753.1 hypothetical protein [Oceanospirillaceae bacterium]